MGLDVDALVRDAAAFLQVPSVTGDERAALERLAEQAAALGLETDLHQHDLDVLRAHPDHPGEEAPRDELWGLTVTLPGTRPGRIAIDGHVDVVSPGTEPWRLGPWSGAIEGGRLHGRGSVDMKGPVVAALHALAALREHERPEVVLMAVSSEEDGGLGTFAELRARRELRRRAAPRADRPPRRVRTSGRPHLQGRDPRRRRARRRAARRPLGDRPLRQRPPGVRRARARRQRARARTR